METPTPTSSANEAGKAGLQAIAEFLKFTTTFAVGTLAFSLNLISSNQITLPQSAKIILLFVWLSLTISLIAGVLVYARIPIQLKNENYNLEDKFLSFPGRIHQITLLLGITLICCSLFFIINAPPADSSYKIKTAQNATTIIKEQVPTNLLILSNDTNKIELIKSIDENSDSVPTWYIQFEVKPMKVTNDEEDK